MAHYPLLKRSLLKKRLCSETAKKIASRERSLRHPLHPMKFEHFALNVPDVRAMARWYVEHLGLQVVRSREDAPYTHFLGDDTGRVFIEIYSNPLAIYPDYAAQHPLIFHFAMFSA